MNRWGWISLAAFAAGTTSATAHAAPPTEPFSLVNELEDGEDCQQCHAFPNGPEHQDDPFHAPMVWQGSLMANAARDPVFWAAIAIAHQDDPAHTEDCVRCHAPKAFLAGRGDAIAIDELTPSDQAGIECDLCHRMLEVDLPPDTRLGNALYALDDTAVNGKAPKAGPWAYEPGEEPNHPTRQDLDHLPSSESCGICHDVTTHRERVDDDGVGLGVRFNEQRTYSEWLNSDFADPDEGETCQGCHMPAVENAAGCASFEGDGKLHPTGARRHDLVGANRFMVELLDDLYGDDAAGVVASGWFENTLARMDEFVGTSASLDVTFPEAVDAGDGFALPVRVTNNTGHKLPTGYSEGRVMWLEVTASYQDEVVWSSGRFDQEQGSIEDDAQVRRYEAIAEDFDDNTTLHLLKNNHWVLDSRIPPAGLILDPQTDPVGERYTAVDGVWPNHDEIDYAFAGTVLQDATPGTDDELEIEVRLLYLINTAQYIEVLAEDNETNAAGTDLAALFDERGGATPVLLAQASASVPLNGLDEGGETGTDGGGDEAADTAGETTDPPLDTGSEDETLGATDEGGNDGCGCSHARPATGSPGWLLLGFAGLLGLRRRYWGTTR